MFTEIPWVEVPLIIGIAGLLGTAILVKWRIGVFLVFIWLYIQDVIRRLWPGQPPELMLVGDFVILLIYFSLYAAISLHPQMARVFLRLRFLPVLLIFLGIAVLAAIYSVSPSILTAGLGFRSYFWYVPFALLGYYMFRHEKELEKFCRVLVYTSIPLALMAAFQLSFHGEIDFALMRPFERGDPYHSFALAEGEGIPFITAVFGSHARYARFSLLLFMLGLGLLVSQKRHRSSPWLVVSVVAAAIGVFISGQRAAMYFLVIGFLWFALALFKSYHRVRERIRHLARLSRMGMGGGLATLAIMLWFSDIGPWFVSGALELKERLTWLIGDIALAIERGGWLGRGFGVASQGLHYVAERNPWLGLETQVVVEGGIGKLWFEMGVVGVLAFYIFVATVFLQCRKEAHLQMTVFRQRFATAVYIYFGCLLLWFSFIHHQVVADATTLIPLWFFVGVVFRLKTWTSEHTVKP